MVPSLPAVAAKKVLPRIYASTDGGVVPPTVVKQSLPMFPAQMIVANRGVLEVVIDEAGNVESATMRESINPRYDPR